MITVTTREEFITALGTYLIFPRESIGVEIGVLAGEFSEMILQRIDPETLVLVDPYSISESKYNEAMNNMATAYSTEEDYQNVLKRFEKEIKQEKVIVKRDFSYNAVKDFPDKGFDFAYHDGSHVYFDVKKDLNDWLPKMKDGAIISGHDYVENKSFGVIQAVDEFMEEHGFEMIIFNIDGGDWALKRKK